MSGIMIFMGRMTVGEAGETSYWAGVEKCDDCEGNGVLPRTGSDEPVDSVVCTSGPDEPIKGETPCWTSDEEYDDNEGNVVCPSVVRTTGSDEPVDSVVCTSGPDEPVNGDTPCGTGDEKPVMRNMTIMRGMLCVPVLFVLPGPMSRSTVLFVLPGRMNRSMVTHPAGLVMRNMTIMRGMLSYLGPGPMSQSTVLFVLPGVR